MSLRNAMWAMHEACVEDHLAHRILGFMADKASDDGANFFWSHKKLAEGTKCSVASVKRKLEHLEDLGVIRRGDQSILDDMNWPLDRRPVVWNLLVGTVAQYELPAQPEQNDSSHREERQLTAELHNPTYTPHIPKEDAREKTSTDPSLVVDSFEAWWKVFPTSHRQTGKSNKHMARKRYLEAMKVISHERLLEATSLYREERDRELSKDPKNWQGTHNAQNWLRDHGWEPYIVDESEKLAECESLVQAGSIDALAKLLGTRIVPPWFEGSATEVLADRKRWLLSWWETEGVGLL